MTLTWRIERAPPCSIDGPSSETESAMSAPRSRYILEYELEHGLVDHQPEHEAWLFEWCSKCIEIDGVEAITIDRCTDGRTTALSLCLETQFVHCRSVPDEFRTVLEQVECWVGDLTVICRVSQPAETPRSTD